METMRQQCTSVIQLRANGARSVPLLFQGLQRCSKALNAAGLGFAVLIEQQDMSAVRPLFGSMADSLIEGRSQAQVRLVLQQADVFVARQYCIESR